VRNYTFFLLVIAVSIFVAGCNQADVSVCLNLHSAETQVVSSIDKNLHEPTPVSPQSSEQELLLLRSQYETEVRDLKRVHEKMLAEGSNVETIARALSQMRRDIGIKYRKMTPMNIVEKMHERNLERYGDKDGPTIEFLRNQGKSWEDIIESAKIPGGKDLGLMQ